MVASNTAMRKANPISSLNIKYDRKSVSSPSKLTGSIPHSLFAHIISPSIITNNVFEIIYRNS